MGKTYSGQSYNLGFDLQASKPLDTRDCVDQLDDIYNSETWKIGNNYYVYPGMKTIIKDTGQIAIYLGEIGSSSDIQEPDKWVVYSPGGNTVQMTLEAYNNLEQKDPNTIYLITD